MCYVISMQKGMKELKDKKRWGCFMKVPAEGKWHKIRKLFFHPYNDPASMLAVCMTLKPIWIHSNRNVIRDRRMPTHTRKSDSSRRDDFKKSKYRYSS